MNKIEVRGVWLRRSGNYIVVDVWMPDGTYHEIIREHIDGNFSNCVHAGGIANSPKVVHAEGHEGT